MDQRQKSKLSSLNDEDIATFLDLLEIDDDTDVEEDFEDLLDENVDDAELPIDTGIDEVINRAVNLSDSMLESEVFQSIPMTQRLCDDEQMCAPKMRTFLRQYLPDKPHKWGIKLFVLCDSFGFCYNFEIYCGAGDNAVLTDTPDLGASANVVVRLSRNIPDFKNHITYFDNYYTSLPLLVYLKSRGIHSLGTIRSNRIPNCKLPTDLDLRKQPRGYSTEFCGSALGVDISLSVWKDNKIV